MSKSEAHYNETYVIQSLYKEDIKNSQISDESLSKIVLQKSNGNALYCKYIIESISKNLENIKVILHSFPAYDNNLESYYSYLLSTLKENDDVCFTLCGVDYSLSKQELKDITERLS